METLEEMVHSIQSRVGRVRAAIGGRTAGLPNCALHYDMGFFYLYYALGLPTFLSIVIALYLLFTGTGNDSFC